MRDIVEFIHAVFVLKGWTWHDDDRPPSRDDIRKMIERGFDLLDRLPDARSTSSGRILIRRTDPDDQFTDYAIALEVGVL